MTAQTTGVRVYPSDDRGATDIGWLKSRHSFSFGEFQNNQRMGYGALRVLNDDVVAPGAGFQEHGHRDMEIISFVLDGALEHRDSAGNHEVLGPGDVQVMSAGTGIRHAELNASSSERVHFIQIWIMPNRAGHAPRHEILSRSDRVHGQWLEIASGDPKKTGLRINQDAEVAVADLRSGSTIGVTIKAGRLGYLHVATGVVEAEGIRLFAGDALELDAGSSVSLRGEEPAELLFFDLPSA